jgi:hypothetical protein
MLAALDASIAPRPEWQVRGCMCVSVGLRGRTGVFARPRGSCLFRRVLVHLFVRSRCRRLARPRGQLVVVIIMRSYRVCVVYCT